MKAWQILGRASIAIVCGGGVVALFLPHLGGIAISAGVLLFGVASLMAPSETEESVWKPRNGRMTSKQKIAYVRRELGIEDDREALLVLQTSDWHVATALKMLQAKHPITDQS